MHIIDPCSGEGTALAECQHHLGSDSVCSFAIEYNEERAWHSKILIDQCIHGDLQDCIIAQRQFGLLFLNPPYGDLVSDKAGIGNQHSHPDKRNRFRGDGSNAFGRYPPGSTEESGAKSFGSPLPIGSDRLVPGDGFLLGAHFAAKNFGYGMNTQGGTHQTGQSNVEGGAGQRQYIRGDKAEEEQGQD